MFVRDQRPDPDSNWEDRLLRLWTEDECTRQDPDAEKVWQAWERFTGHKWEHEQYRVCLKKVDNGDSFAYLYDNGFVIIDSFDGSSLHMVVKMKSGDRPCETLAEVVRKAPPERPLPESYVGDIVGALRKFFNQPR